MKKLILACVLLASLAAGVGWLLFHRSAAARLVPADLLPPGTLACAELPDLRRTLERGRHTALHELWAEPEIQSFLEQPRAKLPSLARVSGLVEKLRQLQPRQAFAALVSLEGTAPHAIAGFAYDGPRAILEALLAEPRASLRSQWPAGKSELLTYGKAEIQTFTADGVVVAEAVQGPWYFISNDLATLKALLDRAANPPGTHAPSLAGDEQWQHTMPAIPADAEVRLYLRAAPLVAKLSELAAASGQAPDAATLAKWKLLRGAGFASRIEGANFRDSLFLYAPGSKPEEKLPLASLALTTPETMLFYEAALPPDLADQMLPLASPLGVAPAQIAPLLHSLGREMALVLDWPATAEVNGVLAVARGTSSAGLPAELAKLPASGWARSEEDGVTLYTRASAGLLPISQTLAASERYLLLGLNPRAVARAARPPAGKTLADSPAYESARKEVPLPDGIFAYLNTGALIERLYGTARPALAIALAMNPATTPYLDASKLPSAGVLSRHLGATALSRTSTAEGQLIVAQGPVTLPQLLALFAGAGATAVPILREQLPPGVFQSLPGSPPPAAAPAPAAGSH